MLGCMKIILVQGLVRFYKSDRFRMTFNSGCRYSRYTHMNSKRVTPENTFERRHFKDIFSLKILSWLSLAIEILLRGFNHLLSSATLFVKYNKSDRKNWWKVNSIDQGLNEIDRYVEFFVNISEFTDRRTSCQCTCACSGQQNWQGWCCKWRWNSSLVRTARANYRKGEFVVLFINDVMPTMFFR